MKKILPIFLMLFAFSFAANAQTEQAKQEVEIQEKAKKDLHDLSQAIKIDNPETLRGLRKLFISKHTNMSKEGITEAQRKEESNRISGKLVATLKEEQINKLRTLGLFDKLIN